MLGSLLLQMHYPNLRTLDRTVSKTQNIGKIKILRRIISYFTKMPFFSPRRYSNAGCSKLQPENRSTITNHHDRKCFVPVSKRLTPWFLFILYINMSTSSVFTNGFVAFSWFSTDMHFNNIHEKISQF